MLVPYPHSLESKLVYFLLARLVLVLVPALAVLLDLGGGETYAELSAKHFNQWSFVGRDGALVSNERVGVFFASPVRELTQEEILQSVKEALPARVGGLVYGSEAALTSTGLLNVSKDPQQCVAYEYDAATQSVKEVSYPTQCRWAEADLDWGAVSVPASIEKGTVLQFRASTVSSATHRFLADSHNREDYYPDDPNAGKLTYWRITSKILRPPPIPPSTSLTIGWRTMAKPPKRPRAIFCKRATITTVPRWMAMENRWRTVWEK